MTRFKDFDPVSKHYDIATIEKDKRGGFLLEIRNDRNVQTHWARHSCYVAALLDMHLHSRYTDFLICSSLTGRVLYRAVVNQKP